MNYRWSTRGDVAAFFALMPDNLATLAILATILLGFGLPPEIVFGRMVPGTALGVWVGDWLYGWMAFRLARRENNPSACAIPLGLDTPSSIGIAVCVLGPVFLQARQDGMDALAAGLAAWHVGISTMLLIGLFKLVVSFFGDWIRRNVAPAALLGSLAGVGIALLGFMQLANVFSAPVAGLLSFAILFFALVGRMRLPLNAPGVLAAIVAGTAAYHVMGAAGFSPGAYDPPPLHFYFHLPVPTLSGLRHLADALPYVSVSIPFAILTVVGGINVAASAHVLGDRYRTRSVLLVEAFSTIVAGLFGGVAQTTPYAGFPAYKTLGARAGYAFFVGLFIGLGGILGYVSFFVELIPATVLAPILVFLALEVAAQPFLDCPRAHAAAAGMAILPAMARLLAIYLSDPNFTPPGHFAGLLDAADDVFSPARVVVVLGNGFILSGMLWGGFMAEFANRRFPRACAFLLACGALSLFGVVHSPFADGRMFLPWNLAGANLLATLHVAAAYFGAAAAVALLARGSSPLPESAPGGASSD